MATLLNCRFMISSTGKDSCPSIQPRNSELPEIQGLGWPWNPSGSTTRGVGLNLRGRKYSGAVIRSEASDNGRASSNGTASRVVPIKQAPKAFLAGRPEHDLKPNGQKRQWRVPCKAATRTDKEESGGLASAVGLIMGTAVGPGILGLPAATLQAGLIPSSVVIVGVWAYVMASVLLVAELSYAVMAERGGAEVSFTGLAVNTLGQMTGSIVAAVYALLNYALLVACIAGLHSILSCWLPFPRALVCLMSPGIVVAMLAFTPFKAVDSLNKALCGLMLLSIASLVGIGIYVGRSMVRGSVDHGTWSWNVLLPAVPVMVLTLGFHVITPLVCKVLGGRPNEARQAILCGGAVPLIMVLAWNAVILGLSPARPASSPLEPIKLLLSLSTVAAPAVQAFAFAALGTTLIGYALSFPKQLIDTVELFGFSKKARFADELGNFEGESRTNRVGVLIMAIGPPVCVAMICPTAFARALDFAGVYANCFLFGLLPPIMAWAHRYRQPQTGDATQLVPGGRVPLVLLFLSALFLAARPTALKMAKYESAESQGFSCPLGHPPTLVQNILKGDV